MLARKDLPEMSVIFWIMTIAGSSFVPIALIGVDRRCVIQAEMLYMRKIHP